MAYEANYYQYKSSGSDSGTESPGGDGSDTPQTLVEIEPSTIISRDFTIMTAQNGGDIVGSGNLTMVVNGPRPIYKLSATLPVSDPPTFEHPLFRTYYANIGNFSPINWNARGTDDGLSLFRITIIGRIPDSFLRIDYYGGSGNGVMNTILKAY